MWSDDEDFQDLYRGIFAEFLAVARVQAPKALDKAIRGTEVEHFWTNDHTSFQDLHLAQSIYKPIRIANAILVLIKNPNTRDNIIDALKSQDKKFYVLLRSLHRALKFLNLL